MLDLFTFGFPAHAGGTGIIARCCEQCNSFALGAKDSEGIYRIALHEVRPAPRGQERLREAAKLGFATAARQHAPPRRSAKAFEGLRLLPASRVGEAIAAVRELRDED